MALTKISHDDNDKAVFGTSEDLQIYHNSSHSYIDHTGTGDLWIRSTPSGGDIYSVTADNGCFVIQNASGEGQFLSCSNGSTDLYYDNVKKLQTSSVGIEVLGAEGANSGVYIYADEGDDNNDKWRIEAEYDNPHLWIQNYTGGSWESNIKCVGNGNVELYYDGTKKLDFN